MAHFNKVGLIILNDDQTKFMSVTKDNFTSDYILPGGQIEKGEDDIRCLTREIKEELEVDINHLSLKYIGEYVDVAAGDPNKDVAIKLYQGEIIGKPQPSQEVTGIHWLNKDCLVDPKLSPIIKNKIMPDLLLKGIIK